MNLSELKINVDAAIEAAAEFGVSPVDIPVSLQIDGLRINTPDYESVWSSDDVELHYDNDGNTSGCVLTAWGGVD